MTCKPSPRDTSGVVLPRPIEALTELLARNTHENRARQRIGEGWKYGPRRDDTRKEHPRLVPYEKLSESDKDYDRQTAMGDHQGDPRSRLPDREGSKLTGTVA